MSPAIVWLLTVALAEPAPSLREAAASAQVGWPPPALSLSVDKSDRELTVWSGEIALKTYRVGLGGAPQGDKARQGDLRTPVGDLRVVTRNPQSQYHLFLGLSYPTDDHARQGLASGLITRAQHDAILAANAAGRQPPWNTALGGAIGIHGRGGSTDWTLGCVAVEDTEMDELWEIVRHGTPVRIRE